VNAPHRVRGVTLIELVFTIAILGLAASAVLGVMNYVSRGSADALVAQQAEAIANAYLQRALASTFAGVTPPRRHTGRACRDGSIRSRAALPYRATAAKPDRVGPAPELRSSRLRKTPLRAAEDSGRGQ
jgi:prepilin-type N-terminal cleavage/methylation domain-containing protein